MIVKNNFNDTESLIMLEHRRYMDNVQKRCADVHSTFTHSTPSTPSQPTRHRPLFSMHKKTKPDDKYDIVNDLYRITSDDIITVAPNIWQQMIEKLRSLFPHNDKSDFRE